MAIVLPVIPNISTLFLHTGNTCSWKRISQHPSQSPLAELTDCLDTSLRAFLKASNEADLQYASEMDLTPEICRIDKAIPPEEANSLKLTVKMFLHKDDPSLISQAVRSIKDQLGADKVDSFLVSFPPLGEAPDMDRVKVTWEGVEEMVDEGSVLLAGVSDFDLDRFKELHSWAKHKPTTNQVNVASCCEIPADLVQYSQENEIQLLTHNDLPEILTDAALGDIMAGSLTPRDSQGWSVDWVVRYSVLVKGRGIIRSKGYLLQARRDFDEIFNTIS